MKVKCVRTSLNDAKNTIINSIMVDYLSVGELFDVFGMQFCDNISYVCIFNNDHLIEVPLDLFEIVASKVPSEWIVKKWDNGDITLWPELFYRDYFFDNFSEREIIERTLFEEIRNKFK